MTIRFHPHALQRMRERGATREQVVAVIETGRASPGKFRRRRFRKVLAFNASWNGRRYRNKQIDAFAVKMPYGWLVITVIVRYF